MIFSIIVINIGTIKHKTFLFIILGPFLVPVPPLENTLPPRQLAGPDSRFITVNGLDVHYELAGHLPLEECPAAFIETFANFFFLYNQ